MILYHIDLYGEERVYRKLCSNHEYLAVQDVTAISRSTRHGMQVAGIVPSQALFVLPRIKNYAGKFPVGDMGGMILEMFLAHL